MEVPQDAKTLTVLLLDFSRTCVFSNIYIYIYTHTQTNQKTKKTKKEHLMCFTLFLFLFLFSSSFHASFSKEEIPNAKEYVHFEQQSPWCYKKCAKKKSNHYQY